MSKIDIFVCTVHENNRITKVNVRTDVYYPIFGYKFVKPKIKSIKTTDACCIVENVSIIKRRRIDNSTIVGFGITLSNYVG